MNDTAKNLNNVDTSKVNMRNFELLKVLGTGAYGKVFLVRKVDGKDAGKLYAMKVLKKANIVQKVKTTEHIRTERQVLASIRQAPFLCKLYYAFQTDAKLHLILEYIRGGELFTHLFKRENFNENEVKFYIGEITLALEHLHNMGIIYRDIKLENILLDHEGHVCLCDFGLSKEFMSSAQSGAEDSNDRRTYSFCGTIEYMSPELIQGDCGHNFTVDWWSLGVLTYELLTGASPFTIEGEKNVPADISKRILKTQPPMPRIFSKHTKDFITKLLNKMPNKRLGANGASEVKAHPFFESINWVDLANKRIPPPFKPSICNELDTTNFAEEFTRQAPTDSPAIVPNCENLFRGYSYIAPSIIFSNNILSELDSSSISESINSWLKNSAFNQLYEVDFGTNLGVGSFSVCKKCKNRKTGEWYAVKIISRHRYDATNEVKYLSKCQGHDNIVKLYDVLQDDLHTYIIMELLSGGELFERLQTQGKFGEREASLIVKSLVSAIQFMHSQGVVHRDLKPENILFSDRTASAKIKIVDFGFARLKPNDSQKSSQLQTPCFTLSYGAPEVLKKAIKQNPGGYDESCDFWSLGVILYTMLTGTVPFSNTIENNLDSDEKPSVQQTNQQQQQHQQQTPSNNKSKAAIITQEKIIERIKNYENELKFDVKHGNYTISESAKQLLKGLLNVDPKKRMKMRDLARNEWIRTAPVVNAFTSLISATAHSNCANQNTSDKHAPIEQEHKKLNTEQLKSQFNLAINAYHVAESQGLLFNLKDVSEAPLAKRRQHKRSTSSNASSESNMSSNSMCSSLSTSTNINFTPTKKCPSTCGKQTEHTVFTFNDSYVNEYLKQQQLLSNGVQHNNQVFNRPITRSITHHNQKFNTESTVSEFCEPKLDGNKHTMLNMPAELNVSLSNPDTSAGTVQSLPMFDGAEVVNRNGTNAHCSTDTNAFPQMSSPTLLSAPPIKRLKRCSTILID
jgi:ribosomal protein S6 kinase alpha-5